MASKVTVIFSYFFFVAVTKKNFPFFTFLPSFLSIIQKTHRPHSFYSILLLLSERNFSCKKKEEEK